MTRQEAINTRHRQYLYHVTEKDSQGRPSRVRVNGMCKTWKRNDNFRLPVKYGLFNCFYITPSNAANWSIVMPPANA